MEKIFNLTSTFKALEEDADGGVHICGMASTSDEDRANDVISAEAWTKGGLANFEKNPIILFNHNYDKPIGRATGLKVTDNGLELKAKISKSAPDHVAQLIKEGILGAFSVGFRVKDADYLEETDGLKIKDAELFEVSVVSVPCNQAATFSLAKSFDSLDEYEEFKKTFNTNRVDLAGQYLAKDEDSSVASHTPDGANEAQQEIKMSEEVKTPEIDLEAFAKKVAEETAAKIAMKQAEDKAVAEKAAQEAEVKATQEAEAKAAQEAEVQSAIRVGVESGAERLMKDLEAKLSEKDSNAEEIILQYKKDLEEKNEELTKMRESKRVFSDRGETAELSKFKKEFMYAHLLGVYTNKGWDTEYAKDVFQKASMDYPNSGNPGTYPNLAMTISTAIEDEVKLQYRLAQIFREINMNAQSMVLPLQRDTGPAVFNQGGAIDPTGASASALELAKRGGSAGDYAAEQKVLTAHRLISTTFMDNHIDEEVLVNLMPMLTEGVARAHARAVDSMVLNGNTSGPAISGLDDFATESLDASGRVEIDGSASAGTVASLTSGLLLGARKDMGKYGLNPADVTFVVSQKRYYDLIADPGFADITDVGSDVATKLTGSIGAVYGSPVIISDNFPAEATGATCAIAVARNNYVIPRLRGVNVEQDYEIARQRRVVVAHQSLGFDEMFGDAAGDRSCVSVKLAGD